MSSNEIWGKLKRNEPCVRFQLTVNALSTGTHLRIHLRQKAPYLLYLQKTFLFTPDYHTEFYRHLLFFTSHFDSEKHALCITMNAECFSSAKTHSQSYWNRFILVLPLQTSSSNKTYIQQKWLDIFMCKNRQSTWLHDCSKLLLISITSPCPTQSPQCKCLLAPQQLKPSFISPELNNQQMIQKKGNSVQWSPMTSGWNWVLGAPVFMMLSDFNLVTWD